MNLLSTQNLSIGYPPNKILGSGIDLTLQNGQLIGLIGQNGVGKSTLIRTICGLQKQLNGEIQLKDQSVTNYSIEELAKEISVVLTGKPETLSLSVIELVALGRYPYSGWLGTLSPTDKQKIEEAIDLMEINYVANKRLFELSDGQLQKVMIARALAQDTDIIILDEPTSHLDLRNKIEVLRLLKKIATSGKAVLISTHEIQLSSEVCDEFWGMDFGVPMLIGSPRNLITSGDLQKYLHVPNAALK